MYFQFTREWLRKKIEADPDVEVEAGILHPEAGWVLVPREPTKAMIEAGLKKSQTNPHQWCPAVYRAMVDAAPEVLKQVSHAILTSAEQKAQATRCGCKGSDDYCVCQNAPDKVTLAERARLPGDTLSDGVFCRNRRGDVLGPMEERTPGHWIDQYGVLYHANGQQWNHVETSTGNIDMSTLAFPTPGGDGCFCAHHPDDPAHGAWCYEPPIGGTPIRKGHSQKKAAKK